MDPSAGPPLRRTTLRRTTLRRTTLRRTTLRRTAQNFALFFPSSRHNFPLLGSFRGILLVSLKARTLKCAHLGPAAPPDRAAGARTRQPENSKRAHFRAPGASNTTKIPRKDPKREKEERKLWQRRAKKARNFGPPTLRGSTLRGPTFSRFGPPPFGAHPSRAPHFVVPKFNIQKLLELAEVEIGRSRNWPKSITPVPHRVVLRARGVPRREVHEKQIVPKSSHCPRFFGGQGWFAKVWAQNGLIKKGAKRRSGPKWKSGQKPKKTSNQNIVETRKTFKNFKNSEKSFAFSYFTLYYFSSKQN